MKILSINHVSDLYGASRCLARVAGRLAGEGHELIVVMPQAGPLKEELERHGIRVLLHPWLPIIDRGALRTMSGRLRLGLSFPASVLWLAWIMVRCRIDLVHSNSGVVLSPAFAAKLTGRPHAWHIREFFLEFPGLWRRYERVIHLFSTVVIAVSGAVKEQFSSCFRGKVEVVYDGLPRDEFHPSAVGEAAQEFRRRFGLGGSPLAGVIGRLKWVRKGQEVLIRAAALLREKYPDAMYVVVGSPAPGNEDHLRRFRILVDELDLNDRVVFTGDIGDVRPVYAAMDVTVVPSIDPEPFGCIVAESMAIGTPVIGSNAAGIAEQIVDGENGLLFRPGSEEQLASALDRLFADEALRRDLSRKGVELFLGAFEMDRCYREHIRVFEGAIARRRLGGSRAGGPAAESPGVAS